MLDEKSDNYELEEYLKIRDFYSKYINSNKPINTEYKKIINGKSYNMEKKIYSNNIYTLFFRRSSLEGLSKTKDAIPLEVFRCGIDKYYESLEKYSENEAKIYKEVMLKAFEVIYKDLKNLNFKKDEMIKIFIKKDIEEYKRVSEKYLKNNLFNKNDSAMELNGKIYGFNNYNYGLNNKKPYLELKSTNYKVGSYVSDEDVHKLNNLYIWLRNNSREKTILKIPDDWTFNGEPKDDEFIKNRNIYIVKVVTNDKGVTKINDYRYVSNYNVKIKKFTCKNYLEKEHKIVCECDKVYDLNDYTSRVWFGDNNKNDKENYIRKSYYDLEENKSKLSNWKKEILKQYSNLFFELFELEQPTNFVNKLDEIAIKVIEKIYINDLKENKNNVYNTKEAFNLWIAYKEYFSKSKGDEEMKINNIQEQCERIVGEKGKIETDDQYFYLAGQVIYYILSKSKAEKITQDITEPFIRANTLKKLKEEIKFLYEKYKHDIYLKYGYFNNIMSEILLKEPEEKIKDKKEILLAGLLANNLFYSKQENVNNGGNEDE